jgi:DNA-binding protein
MSDKESIEKIYIGDKIISKYISACFFALNADKECIQIIGRGNNVKRSIDVAAILLRQYLDVPQELPSLDELEDALNKDDIKLAKKLVKQMRVCEIKIGSEKFQDRNVSTIDIMLRGKKKNVPAPISKEV